MSPWTKMPIFTLRTKIVALACIASLATSFALGTMIYIRSGQLVLSKAVDGLSGEARLVSEEFGAIFSSMENDVFVLAQTPPIQGIIRATRGDGIDPLDRSTTELWRNRLATIFSGLIAKRPSYTQIRYIGIANSGREIVRVNRRDSHSEIVEHNALQEKGAEPYFKTAVENSGRSVMFSDITYNRERGQIETDLIPTIRAILPVFDDKQNLFGFIIINANFESLVRDHLSKITHKHAITFFSKDGDYLTYMPNGTSTKTQLHFTPSYRPPDFWDEAKTLTESEQVLIGPDQVTAIARVNAGPEYQPSTFYLAVFAPKDELFAPARAVRRDMLLLTSTLLLILLAGTMFLATWVTRPIREMTETIRNSKPDSDLSGLPTYQQDEVGALARAFLTLASNLRSSEQRIHSVVNSTYDGHFDWRLQDDYEYMSPKFWKMLGYDPATKQHHHSEWKAVIFPEDLDLTLDNLDKHVKTRGEHPYSQEVRYRHANGSTVTALCRGVVVDWDSNGRPLRLMGTHTDISQIKAFEEKLREQEERSRAIFENVIDGIITINETGVIQQYNPSCAAMFGYTADEAIGHNVRMLMPEPYHSAHDGYLSTYRRTGQKKILRAMREVQGRRKDGGEFDLELSVSEVLLPEGRLFTGVVRDVSHRKQMETMKDQFVSTVNHELRTPLTSVKTGIEVVLREVENSIDEELKTFLEISHSNCERLCHLVDDILDLEKIAAGKMDYDIQRLEMCALIKDIVARHCHFAEKYKVKFLSDFQVDEAYCNVDGSRFNQALVNLLSNAAKFSPEGGKAVITVKTSADRTLEVAVSDNGPGIPKSFHSDIFQPFAQADSSASRRKGGTGLGLSITRAIVEAFDGTVTFTSEEGLGATFYLRIPLSSNDKRKGDKNWKAA